VVFYFHFTVPARREAEIVGSDFFRSLHRYFAGEKFGKQKISCLGKGSVFRSI
jgi:hypothetical protein